MRQDVFQTAAARAEAAWPPETWWSMSATARAAAIYRELRALDERAANMDTLKRSGAKLEQVAP